jgi:glycosyltransferase involved in cell wall biosynthesis
MDSSLERSLRGEAASHGGPPGDELGELDALATRSALRVGVVAPPWVPVPPPAYGGTEAVLEGVLEGLVELGAEVVLVAHPDSRMAGVELLGGPSGLAGAIGVTAVELEHAVFAYDELIARGVDVVHDHTLAGPFVAASRAVPFPVVVTNHGPFEDGSRRVFRAVARTASIVSVSHSQAARSGDVPVAEVIHHGVRPGRFPAGDGDGGYALFLGRMAPTKGLPTAISAARAAGVRLVIAAKCWEDEEVRYFEREIEPLLGDGVEYVGEVGGSAKLALLGGAVALLNPIQWEEPFGMTMIEALACGTPVIVTRRGAAPEIVADELTGFLCDDEAEIVRALHRVGQLDRQRCRASVQERFSATRCARRHLELYERLVRTRAVASRSRARAGRL